MQWSTLAATVAGALLGFLLKMLNDWATESSRRKREDKTRFLEHRVRVASDLAATVMRIRVAMVLRADHLERLQSLAERADEDLTAHESETAMELVQRIKDLDLANEGELSAATSQVFTLRLVCADRKVTELTGPSFATSAISTKEAQHGRLPCVLIQIRCSICSMRYARRSPARPPRMRSGKTQSPSPRPAS